jgi:PAS domain S-box-containing protein
MLDIPLISAFVPPSIEDAVVTDVEAAYLSAIVESSNDAIIAKSPTGIVTSWNRAAETMFGYRADEIVGQSISLLIPPDRMSDEDLIIAKIGRGEKVEHFETLRRRKDGQEWGVFTSSKGSGDYRRVMGITAIGLKIFRRF